MQTQREEKLLALFRRMNEKEQEFALGFMLKFAPEKALNPPFRLIVGGRGR